jgi:pimeloyl-ACP methyl ester carboxylesterase
VNKRILKILAIILGTIIFLGILLVSVGPFLIPIEPEEGLLPADQAAAVDSKFLTIPFSGTDGIEIHYLEKGSDAGSGSPTFVLLHGSNFNAFTWSEVIDFLSQKGQVIAYDQIPYGLSEKLVAGDWDEDNPYTSTATVEQLFSLLDEFDVESAVLVGNSYGASLAVQAALAQPERIEALVLADAAIYVDEEMPAWLLELPQMRRLGPLLARQIGKSEDFIRQTYLNPDQISADRMGKTLIQTQIEDWDAAFWEYLKAWNNDSQEYTAQISDIDQPVLVISGDSDAIVPVADSQRLHSELPNSKLSILPSCGHVPQEECPELFMQAVDEWLGQISMD